MAYEHRCRLCKYQWYSRLAKPKACPKCKTYNWSENKKIKGEQTGNNSPDASN